MTYSKRDVIDELVVYKQRALRQQQSGGKCDCYGCETGAECTHEDSDYIAMEFEGMVDQLGLKGSARALSRMQLDREREAGESDADA